MIFDASGVRGIVATEEEFAIPADDDVHADEAYLLSHLLYDES